MIICVSLFIQLYYVLIYFEIVFQLFILEYLPQTLKIVPLVLVNKKIERENERSERKQAYIFLENAICNLQIVFWISIWWKILRKIKILIETFFILWIFFSIVIFNISVCLQKLYVSWIFKEIFDKISIPILRDNFGLNILW